MVLAAAALDAEGAASIGETLRCSDEDPGVIGGGRACFDDDGVVGDAAPCIDAGAGAIGRPSASIDEGAAGRIVDEEPRDPANAGGGGGVRAGGPRPSAVKPSGGS